MSRPAEAASAASAGAAQPGAAGHQLAAPGEFGSRPVHERAEIFAVRKAGDYTEFTVVAPGITAGFAPGHFVAVAVGGQNTAMILRRAFALYGAEQHPGYAGTIQFVVADKGAGTRWLTSRQVGDHLDLVGPLGTPFTAPAPGAGAVLLGGGYGAAPLLPLAAALLAREHPVELVLGAASASRLFGELAGKRLLGQVSVFTDDGSAGRQGRVTDALGELLPQVAAAADQHLPAVERVVLYACGPMGMLRAVGDAAAAAGISAQVAVEEAMACGIGVCMSCVLPVRGADGHSRFLRSCVDGPVFAASAIRWDDVGSLPDDLLGADAMQGH